MIIDCIADLHGHYPELEGGDLLIVAGDCTHNDSMHDWMKFFSWFLDQDYKKRILVGGNHDNFLTQCSSTSKAKELGLWSRENYDYLWDSGTEFKGVKIWGSPWTLTFPGINPHCTAFTGIEKELEAKFKLIPRDTDILITHGPPYSVLDVAYGSGEHCGSHSLLERIRQIKPKLHVFGHIHECYGKLRPSLEWLNLDGYPIFVNCSHVNEEYEPVNEPTRVIL